MNRVFIITSLSVILCLVVLLLLPLLPQDWGDDFSLYIMHAASAAGDSRYNDLFIYNPDTPLSSPPGYPIGFPMLLIPVYLFSGPNLEAMQYYMSAWHVLFGFAVYLFAFEVLQNRMLAVLSGLLVIFHTYSLEFRESILSDIPFLFFLFLFFYLQSRQKPWNITLVAALFAVLIRSTGLLLLAAWLMEALYLRLFYADDKKRIRNTLTGSGLLLIFVIAWQCIAPVAGGYAAAWKGNHLLQTLYENYYLYKQHIEDYFMHLFNIDENVFRFLSWPLAFLFLTGIYSFIRKKHLTALFFCLLYYLVILSYPYKFGGYRMYLPLIPFMWTGIFEGVLFWTKQVTFRRYILAGLFAVLVVLLGLEIHDYTKRNFSDAVFTPGSVEMFEAVKTNTPPGAVIISSKPRAVSLFTQRRGLFVQQEMQPEDFRSFLKKFNIGYVLKMDNHRHPVIDTLVQMPALTERVWENERFHLYRIKE